MLLGCYTDEGLFEFSANFPAVRCLFGTKNRIGGWSFGKIVDGYGDRYLAKAQFVNMKRIVFK